MSLPTMDGPYPISIREMRQEDIPFVREIDQDSFSLPWPESAFDYELNENPGSLSWVAEVDGTDGKKKVAGMLVIWLVLDEAHVATVATAREYRRKEIARRLLIIGLKKAAQMNMSTATLEVRENNIPAINLYRSLGFEIVGNRPHYYVDNHEDALIMTRYHLEQLLEETAQNPIFTSFLEGG